MRLATKRGVLSLAPIDELGTPSNPHVVGDDEDEVPRKKRKTVDGSATNISKTETTLESFKAVKSGKV